jgi:hypothetical protein
VCVCVSECLCLCDLCVCAVLIVIHKGSSFGLLAIHRKRIFINE